MDILELMKKEMLRRRLSHKTIATYLFYVRKFLLFCHKEPKQFSKKDVKDFLEEFMEKDKSGSSINVCLNSLKFMMEEVLRKNMRLNIRYSKVPKRAQDCLTKKEVKSMISVIHNDKHRLLTSIMYGAGLRVSETVKLKKEDIHLDEGIGWVRHGKGNKDRPFIIPECLKKELKERMNLDAYYIFEGNNNYHLSSRSVQEIIKRAARKAGIAKNVHPHTLRHSFATHLLESGYDVTVVQSLLGHNEARTTIGYLHVVKPKLISVKSPLDYMI